MHLPLLGLCITLVFAVHGILTCANFIALCDGEWKWKNESADAKVGNELNTGEVKTEIMRCGEEPTLARSAVF